MADRQLLHIDERLGHVAFDMGLMTQEQVRSVQLKMVMDKAGGGAATSFGQAAMDLGYLDAKDLSSLEAEERRRRRLISGYEIIDLIGSGTIATVYHAWQLAMEREVALKILHPRLASDPVFVRAYIAEAQAISRFHHPNIVQGFDIGESNGFYYFSHEDLSGGSMADKLRTGDANFSEKRLLMYLRQTTAALRHAWAVAVYHGDINPGNLLMDAQGNIKLANLGVPRVAGMRDAGPGGLRIPGFVRCGPEYAAPEQLERPEAVDAGTDMYNLGATFYHISFGSPPFPGVDRVAVLEYRRTNPVPSFSLKSQEAFSGKYLRLIHDMLEPEAAKRPADPEELAGRLEMFHMAEGEDTGVVARRSAPASRSGRRRSAALRPAAPRTAAAERAVSLRRRFGSRKLKKRAVFFLIALAAVLALLIWAI